METRTSADTGLRAGRREWIGLAVLALPTMLAALDFSVVFLALPYIGADLDASNSQLLWITDIYGFLVAGFLVTMGTLGDRIGRRKLLMIGAAVFGVVSVIAAYSTSAEMLIVSRALLGIAGATLMPSTLALIANMFRDARQRTTAISIWASTLLVGVAIGPLVGGLLLESFWWGSAFLIGVPVMILLLLTAPSLLPEYRDENAGRIDLVSVALSLVAILPAIYGIKEVANGDRGSVPLLAIVVGIALGVMFVRRQRRLESPLLDLRLFSNRSFSASLGVQSLGALFVGGVGFYFAQYLQLVQGFSPLKAGLWLIPDNLGLIAGSLLAPVIARRIRPGYVIGMGLGLMTIGFAILTQVDTSPGIAPVVIGVTIVTFGVAPSWVLGTDLVIGSAPPERAGSAAALSETGSEFGLTLGVAVLGSVGVAVYRDQVNIPAEVPAEAAEGARGSFVEAMTAAGQLPADVSNTLLASAREAFTDGFNVASAATVPAAIILAFLAVILLRMVRPSGEPAPVTGEPLALEAGASAAPGPAVVSAAMPVPMPMPAGALPMPAPVRGPGRELVPVGGGNGAGNGARMPVPVGASASPVPMGVSALATVEHGLHHLPGQGVLARYGDLVLLCEARPGQDATVNALVATLADAHPCGRMLSRRLTGLISTNESDGFPALCAFGPAGEGVAALVHGQAELTFTVGGGQQVRLHGHEAVTVVDKIVTEPIESITAVVGDATTDREIDRWSRLDAGVTRADALVYGLGPSVDTTPGLVLPPIPAAAALAELPPSPELPPPPEVSPSPEASPSPEVSPPNGIQQAEHESEDAESTSSPLNAAQGDAESTTSPLNAGQEDAESTISPLNAGQDETGEAMVAEPMVAEPMMAGAVVVEPEPYQVIGVYCKKEHFNDPKVAYCTVCGIAMTQTTRLPVLGVRPPLGVLVLDDGNMFPLVRDHVLGRAPESDSAVLAGTAIGLTLLDPMISRVHARVVLDDWQVCLEDAGSTNGTFLWGPGDTAWTRLPRGAKAALQPGTVAAIGQRQLRYHSYRNN